jgi:hypothetical protein
MKAPVALLLLLTLATDARAGATLFEVTNSGTSGYVVDGNFNPKLTLTRGVMYTFDVFSPGHPFYIKTVRVTGTGSQYTDGVEGNGATSEQLFFTVPMNAPNTLFYQCGVHGPMGGTINIVDASVGVPGAPTPGAIWLGLATPNPMREEAQFQFGLPRSARVDFVMFDQSGRLVRVLTRGELPAGVHAVRWNGRGPGGNLLPSGLYSYRLRVDGRPFTGRLVLLR